MADRSTRRRVGIGDVAARAGVSHATVSRVMNGNTTVNSAIAARVQAAAAELKYKPNPVGRSLALGKTETIGIVVPDLSNPTFQSILRDVSIAAARDGYRVLIADSSEVSSEEAILAGEARRRCDGVVLCAPRMSQDDLEELAPTLHPLVLINRTTEHSSTPSLVVDYGHGIQQLGAHLVELGHRRIAYLTGRSAAPRTFSACAGWRSSSRTTRRSSCSSSPGETPTTPATRQATPSPPAGPRASWCSTTWRPWACCTD